MSGRGPRWFTGIKYPYEANFADNTWAQIIAACQRKSVPDSWSVGDQKAMTIGGADYLIDIIGLNHDDYSDGSGKAPLTLQMHDCYATAYAMGTSRTNAGGWTQALMRTTHLPAILALMPGEVQNGIKEVSKQTSAGDRSSVINSTSDKLFLLSEVEILGTTEDTAPGEGTQYPYYGANSNRIKNRNGSAEFWWERSPVNSSSSFWGYITRTGRQTNTDPTAVIGVSFAFCF